jgi:hypothetical protein
MSSKLAGVSKQACSHLRALVVALVRFRRLLGFGLYVLLWSKIFRCGRDFTRINLGLLVSKSIQSMPPQLAVCRAGAPIDAWSQGFTAVNAVLLWNLQKPDVLSRSRYAHPAPAFRAIYLWDSAFIAQIWKLWDPQVAFEVLHSVVALRQGARLQHYVSDLGGSTFTQPPLVAWSLVGLKPYVDDDTFRRWATILYDPLRDYQRWLYEHRRLPNGLFAWAHPYESGVENAPRFGSRDERRLIDTTQLAAPDFCAYMVLSGEALSVLAQCVGKAEEAIAHQRDAQTLRELTNRYLWEETAGLYFDRDARSGDFVKSRTIASLLPLWAGIPDAGHAERLCRHILDPAAFNTVLPLPTVALNDEAFEKDMWRGPVWLNVAFGVICGLQRYGFYPEAADLAFRLCDGVYRTFSQTGRIYEFYDPQQAGVEELHRKRGNLWKRLTLGAKPVANFVGWSGLVNTLLIENMLGLRNGSRGVEITPRFPPQAEGLRFSLNLPRDELLIEWTVGSLGAVVGSSQSRNGALSFEAMFGETVLLAPKSVKSTELST